MKETEISYPARRLTSLALRMPPFGDNKTPIHLSNFSGSIRGYLNRTKKKKIMFFKSLNSTG